MLCEFYAYDFNAPGPVMLKPEKKHAPLTAVCGDHPLAPAWPKEIPVKTLAKAESCG
jgi:hypothetical protein